MLQNIFFSPEDNLACCKCNQVFALSKLWSSFSQELLKTAFVDVDALLDDHAWTNSYSSFLVHDLNLRSM